ncbi:YARHG domain-containing protein [Sediminitomix flava]|uniref:YARHG domain-containing protein n=1 Tax=Sediminitomix flava TaxID=379075 RepID=A0A315ZEW6_SEDFL|nr:YARHG domain-containing protein [Sediminitomix flava]PWJ31144.1 YARHG domain-containing protein [Sediminitomix flava]
MRNIFFTILLFLETLSCQGQSLSFESLLDLFTTDRSYTEIPDIYAIHYFDYDTLLVNASGSKLSLNADRIVLKTDENIALSVFTDTGAGGVCKYGSLFIFNKDGEKITNFSFESELGDGGFYSGTICIYASDSLLIFNHIDQEYDGDIVTMNKSELDYYRYEDWKLIKRTTIPIDTRRKYFLGSNSFLTREQLLSYSIEELSIIRNEIFASHGYIFKSNKWKSYFLKKDWYKPMYSNVIDSLTLIEKVNISSILEIERK